MQKSQRFGYLLLELVCAISIFTLAATAVGGLITHVVRHQKVIDQRQCLLTAASRLIETGEATSGIKITEGQRVMLISASRSLCLDSLQLQLIGSTQTLKLRRCTL